MKHWLSIAALICLGSPAMAGVETFEVECDTVTNFAINIGSSNATATPLFSASLQGTTTIFAAVLTNRKWLEFENSSSTDAYCGFDVNPSTTPLNWLTYTQKILLSAVSGMYVPKASSKRVFVNSFNSKGYPIVPVCMNSGGAGSTSLGVTQCGAQ